VELETILVERDGPVAIITINRPQVLNALTDQVKRELLSALEELEADSGVRAIVLTGAGDRAFAAGSDINELQALPSAAAAEERSRLSHRLLARIEEGPKPVIAAINGFALGAGCELAMACDIRIASDTARLGQPEVNLAIIPGAGGTQRLPRLVGRGMASLLCLTGDQIDAAEAYRIGLVDKLVSVVAKDGAYLQSPSADEIRWAAKGEAGYTLDLPRLHAEARALAARLAEKAPLAVAAIKRCIVRGLNVDLPSGCAYEAAQFGLVCGTQDRVEGTSAFLEKRRAVFQGK
jgi:enoyl-CoA hydratase